MTKHLVGLETARLAVLPFGHVEDDGMGMKLRCRVAIHGPRGVVLEGRGDDLARCLRRVDIADPRLRVVLKFPKRSANAFAMCLSNAVISAHKRSERH